PTDPRDGIFLTSSERLNVLTEENQTIITEAVDLYLKLLDYAVEANWNNLHHLAKVHSLVERPEWLEEKWYNENVLNRIRTKLLQTKIVLTANGDLAKILDEQNKPYTLFPTGNDKEIRDEIWQLANFWFPHCLPRRQDVEFWNKLLWEKCGKLTLETLAGFIEHEKTMDALAEKLTNVKADAWLNKFYQVLKSDKKKFDSIINNNAIFPNQNGSLRKKSQLTRDKGDILPVFKDILTLLRRDLRARLAHESISSEIEFAGVIDQTDAVKEINTEVLDLSGDRTNAKNYSTAFKEILIWFHEFPKAAESMFPVLFKNKHLLYDDDQVLESIAKAEQLSELLTNLNVKDMAALKELISDIQHKAQKNELLPITQELLASMGITNIDQWKDAMKDKDITELFSHESIPTTDMFLYVQSLIEKAKAAITSHLKSISDYDLTNLDDSTAATVLAGIKKDGKDISIVARPAYDKHVIIYYGSERDVLDFEPSELWIDDGVVPRRISLGHILKTGKIVRFPI
ncbi:MAG TPA: hypothetical protein VFE57_02500, partial [Cyclobacteriaceae bacterium]|nr:hypothetical protein [Cyclobacteriaceae bacterium]